MYLTVQHATMSAILILNAQDGMLIPRWHERVRVNDFLLWQPFCKPCFVFQGSCTCELSEDQHLVRYFILPSIIYTDFIINSMNGHGHSTDYHTGKRCINGYDYLITSRIKQPHLSSPCFWLLLRYVLLQGM